MKIRIDYFQTDDAKTEYEIALKDGESIISIERCLDGGYNTDTYCVFISVPTMVSRKRDIND